MTGRCWVVQINAEGAYAEVLEPADVTWPAVSLHLDDIAPGDRVVMWVSGTGHRAGVFGYGTVDGPLEDVEQKVTYADPDDDRWTMRPSMPVRYTAIFPGPHVTRIRLRTLPQFADFAMFKPGGAQGGNPRPLSEAQWDCIQAEIAASLP